MKRTSIAKIDRALGLIYNGEKTLKNSYSVAAFLEAKRARLETPPSPLLGADEFD